MILQNSSLVGIIGSGAMGSGIAQVAAMAGHQVIVYDANPETLIKAKNKLSTTLQKLQEKGKLINASEILNRITFAEQLNSLASCSIIIEAIVEKLEVKKAVFVQVEQLVSEHCIIATNTSSLSITSIAAACTRPERVVGIHFFNPPPLMALVEIIPAVQTAENIITTCKQLMVDWGKSPVIAKDTPGFIVNRVARPFYGEALRIYEEGIANIPTIDWAVTTFGGFKMGPFTLMDYIGHDVNYVVTETVFQTLYFDPKYKPALSQKRLLEAGWLGLKSGRGFYHYKEDGEAATCNKDEMLGKKIFERILAMLINEAYEALMLNIATAEDLELAMTKGVNYPKGLLQWGKDWGLEKVLDQLDYLYHYYHEERYRASALLRRNVEEKRRF